MGASWRRPHVFWNRCASAVPINLVLSLVFGFGQIAVGALVARRILAGGAWRRPSALLLLAVSCWFVASGACEIFVSGMEAARALGGVPSPATFGLWRARADDALLGVSVALLVLFAGSCAVLRVRHGSARQ